MLDPDQAALGQCFSRLRSLAHRQGPSDPSWIDLAWPLRRRALLPDAGCVGPLLDFEQGFLNGYGPAQVGLVLLSVDGTV